MVEEGGLQPIITLAYSPDPDVHQQVSKGRTKEITFRGEEEEEATKLMLFLSSFMFFFLSSVTSLFVWSLS